MPPHICKAKHIYYKIVLATDRSTGGLEDGGGELNDERDGEFEEDEDEDEEEGGMVEINNNDSSFSADKDQLTMDGDEDGSHINAAAVASAASGRQASDGEQSSVFAIL
jgi:hypothetical protein